MSRLYETLERINRAQQKKEAHKLKRDQVSWLSNHSKRSKRTYFYIIVTAIFLISVGAFFIVFEKSNSLSLIKTSHTILSFFETKEAPKATKGLQRQIRPVAAPKKVPTKKETTKDPIKLNNMAVQLLKKKAYWDALYLLDEAIQIAPHLEAPYYNTVYALVQLGYYSAAQEYCKRIRRLFGETKWLKRNKEALKSLGIDPEITGPEVGGA